MVEFVVFVVAEALEAQRHCYLVAEALEAQKYCFLMAEALAALRCCYMVAEALEAKRCCYLVADALEAQNYCYLVADALEATHNNQSFFLSLYAKAKPGSFSTCPRISASFFFLLHPCTCFSLLNASSIL